MSGIKIKGGASARSKSSTARRVLWLFLVALILLLVVYFTATSSPFLKRFVLPRIGNSLNAELTADSVRLSPFSKLELLNLKITPYGEETLLTGGRLRARYSLIAFLQGRIEIGALLVDSTTINLVEKPDGHSNLDPLLAGRSKKPTAKSSASAPLVVDIKSVQFTNVVLRQTTQHRHSAPEVLQVSLVNFAASDIRNNASGQMEFESQLAWEKAAATNLPASNLAARLRGKFSLDLAGDLTPSILLGRASLTVDQARGDFAELAGVGAAFSADVTSTQVKELALGFTQAGAALGGVRVSGPFATAKREGKLNLEVNGLDRRVLNLLGAASGLDFGTTTINTTNEIELAQGGNVISVFGDLRIGQFQLVRDGQATPKLDVVGDYSVAVDQTKKSALIGSFKLAGTQSGRSVLTAGLSSPMTITWGKAGDTVGSSTFNFALTDVLLENWKPVFGDIAPTGKARLEGKISTRDDGKVVNYELRVNAESVSALISSQRIDGLTITFDAVGEARELQQFKITEYGAQIFHAGQPAFSFQGTANYDRTKAMADAEISVLSALPQLGGMFGAPAADISSGVLEIHSRVLQRPGTNLFAGKLRLVDFSATLGANSFSHFGTDLDLELGLDPKRVVIRKAAGTFTESSKPGGKFSLTGNYGLASGAAEFALRLDDVNQNGLRPFLEPYLGGKKLTTASLRSTAAISLSAAGVKSLKADVTLTNLTATEVRSAAKTQPLQARLQLDAALDRQSAQLRQCLLTMATTNQVKNQLSITGKVDFAKTNAITGAIKLTGESLDLTRAYDLVSPSGQSPRPPQSPVALTGTTSPEVESAPMLPQFDNLIAEVSLDRLTIREVKIENLSARAKLDGTRLVLKPCFLSLNGAPIKATVDVDWSVPGYRYDVSFDAQGVPVAPVVNTFQPERKGQLAGQFTGVATIKGEGVTGVNLQKNLNGQITTSVTNVNLSLANVRSPVLRTTLNTVIAIPELIRNPLAGVENLLGRLVNFGGKKGSWSDELMSTPLEVIEFRLQAGEGRIRLEQGEVRSSALKVRAVGDITLAPVLTNSTIRIPVSVSVNRPLANQIGLVPPDAPTNAAYYAMPQFLEIQGTLGLPESKTDKLVLAELAARAGVGGAKGEKVSGIIQKGGGLLNVFGGKSATNAPANTKTNKSAGPFDLFR